MSMNVNIVIDDPEELERVRQKEMDITKEKIQRILDAGVNAIFTTKGIDDFAMKYLVEASESLLVPFEALEASKVGLKGSKRQ